MTIPHIGLPHILSVGVLLFVLGLYAVIVRRDLLTLLVGMELMLLGSHVNLAAFARFNASAASHALMGEVGTIISAILAACEAVVALVIFVNFQRRLGTLNPDEADALRD